MSANGPPVAVIGAAGFIGRALVARFCRRGIPVIAVARRALDVAPAEGATLRLAGDLAEPSLDWAELIAGAQAVVHLASRAHAPPGDVGWIERDAALAARLARAAAALGVERVLLMSSVKVLGDSSADEPFRAGQSAAPGDGYGFAKWSIEEAMRGVLAGGPALTVLRPPLVYGPGVKANFLALIGTVDRGLPLPFASVANRRSLIYLDNLVDLVETALAHPAARDGTFLLRDEREPSTPELIRLIAAALGKPARLFRCPPALLRFAFAALGGAGFAERLLGSLSVDDGETRQRLGWRPRVPLEEGIAATCRWYRTLPQS
jgi:nucleoside-diphosphate-sugar epimerase